MPHTAVAHANAFDENEINRTDDEFTAISAIRA